MTEHARATEPSRLLSARRTLKIQMEGIAGLLERLDGEFVNAVELILQCKGRIVLTGMGKSGLICQKISATFSSTGTPAQFLHPAEAIHGDLGIITLNDLVIAASYSGETEEVIRLLPTLKRFSVPLIAITGRPDSTLAKAADVHINVQVRKEACPLGLAPTTSTTATLAIGDALAIALLEARGFTADDFAVFHPGGALGKRLLLRVGDVMHTGSDIPLVNDRSSVRDALFEITGKRMGITGVVGDDGRLVGVFTDGDLRRLMATDAATIDKPIGRVMSPGGKRIDQNELAAKALQAMEELQITSLFVIDADNALDRPVGVVHLHDLLKVGIA